MTDTSNVLTSLALALPDGVTVSQTALVCPQQLTIDEWKSLGCTLRQLEGSIQWWIGDWWHYGFHRYGERKAMATAKDTFDRAYAFGTLMNYGYVAGSVETSRRREVLSFSHHVVVAPLEPDEQEHWLEIAVEDKLSVAKLRQKMFEDEHPGGFFTDDELEQRTRNYFYRLERAAEQIPKYIVPPWADSVLEHYLERYFLTHRFLPPGSVAKKFEEAATFYSKTAEFVRRIESKKAAEVRQLKTETFTTQEKSHELDEVYV